MSLDPTVTERFDERAVAAAIGAERADRLARSLDRLGRGVVAFSGGVDSAVVAAAAARRLGREQVRVVMAIGPAVAEGERQTAERVARAIGLDLQIVEAGEIDDPAYVRNDVRRCFYCKTNLYRALAETPEARAGWPIVNGTNADDLGDYRPGLEAASQHDVVSPLVEAGIGKDQVRELARLWQLEVHDKPATPCLASRIVYGISVTPERLSKIDAAERFLKGLGFATVRVRLHGDDLARIELDPEDLTKLLDYPLRSGVVDELVRLGFRYITLDLFGFRSGSLNPGFKP
ncbi:MAG TPA: ATP-dependent sacrificial sulfur transferase LarE [Pirellulaceae bacterium]|nr:ATP-dependent sacrificial sulfur transferase LarE [Pirellulaceae bacterium]